MPRRQHPASIYHNFRRFVFATYEKYGIDAALKLVKTSSHIPTARAKVSYTLTQFELKFKHVPERLYTQKAREIAKERLRFMENFFEKLKREIKGEV